jgi:uncharacterized protein
MSRLLALLSLLFAPAIAAPPPPISSAPCSVALPGFTFTRSLNDAAAHARIADGRLELRGDARTNSFRSPDGKFTVHNAPVLLAEIDNRQPFTFTAKVTPGLAQTYDAGALFLFVRDDLWFKLALELDERKQPRMVTVRTIGTSDDNNHDVISTPSVYMKISSNTRTIGFYYSLDNQSWQLIRLFKNDYPESLWIGVSAQSPLGQGMTTVFENLALQPQSIANFRLGL